MWIKCYEFMFVAGYRLDTVNQNKQIVNTELFKNACSARSPGRMRWRNARATTKRCGGGCGAGAAPAPATSPPD